jgi:hypothetical protein
MLVGTKTGVRGACGRFSRLSRGLSRGFYLLDPLD